MRKLRGSRSRKIVTNGREGGPPPRIRRVGSLQESRFSSEMVLLQRSQVLELKREFDGIHREMDEQAFTVYYF